MITTAAIVKHLIASECGRELENAAEAAEFLFASPDERAHQLAAALTLANLKTLDQFDQIVLRIGPTLPRYFKRIRSVLASANKPRTRASTAFLGELVLILDYPTLFPPEYLVSVGWDMDIAQLVIEAAHQTLAAS